MSAAYADALASLQRRGRFGIRLGLARTNALLRALGDPQLRLHGALIAGTNGKGSVQAMVAAALTAAGHRVGQTPKPHLVSYRERILVGGVPITVADFAPLIEEVGAIADRLTARHGPPTEFEVLTAAALTWFERSNVDVAVVEVGLGGRLDATNAWDGGVAAITNVQLDHMDRLGSTLREIGREKAAIIKRGDLAVTGATGPGLDVTRRRARALRVPLVEVSPLRVVAMDRHGLDVEHERLGALRVGLLGRHQAANAAVAVAVLEALGQRGTDVPDHAIRSGLRDARWPGRLELLSLQRVASGTPDVLLDGAHNAAGMEALTGALRELRASLSSGRATLLVGLMGDKDVTGITRELAEWARDEDVLVITTSVDAPRALPALELAAALRTHEPRMTIEPVEPAVAALDRATEHAATAGGPLIVCGSLYLVGEVRARLVADPALRDPEA
jgi:dihydrofolate synthase/folylpolyglutamate synthase